MFRAIARYLAKHKVRAFQFENVLALANKPTKNANDKQVIGPSNLSAVSAILRNEARMWSHTWQVDSHRDFGSGQQRQRLWGICFRLDDLCMDEDAARGIMNDVMNTCAGVTACHPKEYLLPETDRFLRAERQIQVAKTMGQEDIVGETSLDISKLFETGGVVPCVKKRRLRKVPSETSPSAQKWVKSHAQAFRDIGQDTVGVLMGRACG